MRVTLMALLLCVLVAGAGAAFAASPPATLGADAPVHLNSAQTARYMALLPELRCMQCQNESLASSQAPWAQQVRARVRTLIANGESNHQIKQYLVARYGEYVLYKPPFQASTWALWVGPFVLLVLGVTALLIVLRRHTRRAQSSEQSAVSAEALERVRHWLEEDKQ
ncbi:MAG TPA: cytochrome c-type biogenesis protein [Gammaproteobacteria bacterium]|nr:cytochrome c-type biogenesis protein [Gammaproteobacteria bacterium]